MFCNSCGTENVDAAQFCFRCGTVQVPAPAPPSWPGSSSMNIPPPTTNNSVQGYGNTENYPSVNYSQPLAAPSPYTQQPPYAPVPQPYVVVNNPAPRPVVIMAPKSVGTAIVLSLFFGPLGMLYSTVAGGLIMIVVNLIIVLPTLGLGLLLTQPICVIWAAVAASTHNSKLYRYAQGG